MQEGFRVGPSRYREVHDYIVSISRAIRDYLLTQVGRVENLSRDKALDVAENVEKALIIADRTGGRGLAFAENIATLYRIAIISAAEEKERVDFKRLLSSIHEVIEGYVAATYKELASVCEQLSGRLALYLDYRVGKECIRLRKGRDVVVIDDRPFSMIRRAAAEEGKVTVYPYIAASQVLDESDYLLIELLSLSSRYGIAKSGARPLISVLGDTRARLVIVVPGVSVRSIMSYYSPKALPRYQIMLEWMEHVYFPLYDVVDVENAHMIHTESVKLDKLDIAGLEGVWRNTLSRLLEEALAKYVRSV